MDAGRASRHPFGARCSGHYAVGMSIDLTRVTLEDFQPLAGTALSVRAGDVQQALQLESVQPSPYPTGRDLSGFSLYLRGDSATAMAQGIVSLQHPALGPLELFMTPIGRDARGMRYEIIFN